MGKRSYIILSCVILLINNEVLSDPVPAANSALIGNKAYEKCVEYSNLAYGADSKLNDGKPIPCGQHPRSFIYTEDAAPKQFPNAVLLGYVDDNDNSSINWLCSGTLISDEFVLTSAHCLSSHFHMLKKVRVGELNYNDENDDAKPQDYEIAEEIIHPDYKSRYNDIGLLRLKEKVTLSSYVLPACLNWQPDIEDKQAILLGWGTTELSGEKHEHLQNVHLDIFEHEQCKSVYELVVTRRRLQHGILNESQLCAGHHGKGNEICQGSGPLQVYQKDDIDCMYSVVGVTSFGISCSENETPAVHTRVSHYVKWIESIVWP